MAAAKPREIVEAASLNAQACDFCTAVHVNLIDEEGDIFASGNLPLHNVEPFIAQIRASMAQVLARHSAPARRQ